MAMSDKIHCVFIGINEYRDSSIPRLHCAVNDAHVLGDLFEGVGAEVTLILDSQATGVALRRALWALPWKAAASDTVVVYFAGHGARVALPSRHASPQTVPCLVPYDAHHNDLLATGIAMEELVKCFESILSKRVLFLFDSCYSGGVASCRSFARGERGGVFEQPVLPRLAGEGTIVLAASKEYQPAFEDEQAGHGVFTGSLIEALTGKVDPDSDEGTRVSLDAVQQYLQNTVPARTQHKFNNPQVPVQFVGRLTERFLFPIMRPTRSRSLAGFPHQFLPLTVVVGDRREPSPRSLGDLLALSASPAELRWLLRLRLPQDTEIVSDKLFVQHDENELRRLFGSRNLLVVGSPAANFLARIVNTQAFFPFAIAREGLEWYQREIVRLQGITTLDDLMDYVAHSELRSASAHYINKFRKSMFIDPVFEFGYHEKEQPDADCGTVTIARNPYANAENARHVCILAAGTRIVGTMHSLKLLCEARRAFADRPLGGVFSVQPREPILPVGVGGKVDYTDCKLAWKTNPYSIDALRRGLEELKVRGINELTKDEIEHLLGFLVQISRERT